MSSWTTIVAQDAAKDERIWSLAVCLFIGEEVYLYQ